MRLGGAVVGARLRILAQQGYRRSTVSSVTASVPTRLSSVLPGVEGRQIRMELCVDECRPFPARARMLHADDPYPEAGSGPCIVTATGDPAKMPLVRDETLFTSAQIAQVQTDARPEVTLPW